MSRYIYWIVLPFLLVSCQKPMADFLIQSEDRVAPTTIEFDNKSQNADAYEWDFGDGNQSSDFNATHQYSHSGRYVVSLTAKKGNKVNISTQEIILAAPVDCHILMETSMGNMTFKLSDATPEHRDNFIKLTKDGFYEGILFHRVIQGFMAQGGDPLTKESSKKGSWGTGGPGYTVPAEFVDSLVHVKGALAAARTGGPANPEKRSSGSQFYIVQGKKMDKDALMKTAAKLGIRYSEKQIKAFTEMGGTPFLDQNYTVFGQLVEGFDVLDAICATKTNASDQPESEVKILRVSVIE